MAKWTFENFQHSRRNMGGPMFNNSLITRLLRTTGVLISQLGMAAVLTIWLAGTAFAAGIKIVPSAQKVTPGESFYADVVVDGIPSEGLGAVQFRLNVSAPGSTVATFSDTSASQPSDVSVSSPLMIGPATTNRSGIGDFFWNAKSSHGILVMDNETLQNGSGLYTLGHTNGAALPSGSGAVARFQINAGKDVAAEKIIIYLSDVVLLDGSTVYSLDSNTGATVDLKCYTQVPNLIGLTNTDATTVLAGAKLTLGTVYEIDNTAGTYTLNTVLVQSANVGTTILCDTPVDLAINTPPAEAGNVHAADKAGDESGTIVFSWAPSSSSDAAGYRIYNASGLRLAEIGNAASAGVEISGQPMGAASQFRITAYDTHGNESAGVALSAVAVDDVAPRVTVSGVTENAYYASDVQPAITVQEANLAVQEITLNGAAYNQLPIATEGSHLLKVSATDTSGNSTVKEIRFTIDKTPPVITVAGIERNRYYNTDLSPAVSVADANLETVETALNGAAYTSGTVITAENNYELVIQAVDKAGNGSSDTYPFFIDKTFPTSTIAVGTPQFENGGMLYVAVGTPFTLAGNDAGAVASGVDRLEYRANGEAWNLYQTPVTLAGLNDGPVAMDYRAVDRAANVEGFHTLSVTLDAAAPLTTLTLGQPQYIDAAGAAYVTQNTVFTFSASDALSGVALTEYKLGAGAWVTAAPFTIANEGTHTILYRSKDNLGNPEADKSFTAIVDNTPPVTTITTGDPKYTAADEKLYVTSATMFTLAATDNLSGVAVTEYRIDGGSWTTDAPFTVSAEGTHTIDYYSKDNVTNAETVKTLTVIVDNTAPVSTITVGSPQYQSDGKLYVSGSTGITMTASDALSGVKKTEFSMDGGEWNVYTAAFTLVSYADGAHTIRYRFIDNVNNPEDAKELVVILDKTPPQAAIAASDPLIDGVINTVSPSTFFTLSAMDALSGVKSTAYRINNGSWQTYTGSFSLAGMNAGQYTIGYKATDNVLNEEAEKTITVRMIIIQVEKKIAADSVVLVGVESDNSDLVQKQIDMQRLGALLMSLSVNYTIAENMDEFTAALRSGRYNTYILIDVKEPLIGEEVREAVHYGDGLIFIKTRPNADPFLDDVFGVKIAGKTTSDDLIVDLLSSPICADGTLQTTGKSVVSTVAAEDARVFGTAVDKHNTCPSIIFNQYERGKVLLYTFDLLNAADQSLASALLVESLNFVRPAAQTPKALGNVPIRITLTNSTEPVEVKVVESLPAGAAADTIVPGATPVDNTLTWQKSMAADEQTTFRYYLNLPDMAGDYLTKTELAYSNNGFFRPYDRYELLLTVQNDSADLLQNVITELRGLQIKSVTDADLIAKVIDHLLLVNADAANRNDAEDNIRHIIQAIDEARKLSVDISSIRIELDELLMIWQKKWYLAELPK